jgi:hypothetical protein
MAVLWRFLNMKELPSAHPFTALNGPAPNQGFDLKRRLGGLWRENHVFFDGCISRPFACGVLRQTRHRSARSSMDRVLPSEGRGCWFDPSRAHQ